MKGYRRLNKVIAMFLWKKMYMCVYVHLCKASDLAMQFFSMLYLPVLFHVPARKGFWQFDVSFWKKDYSLYVHGLGIFRD